MGGPRLDAELRASLTLDIRREVDPHSRPSAVGAQRVVGIGQAVDSVPADCSLWQRGDHDVSVLRGEHSEANAASSMVLRIKL